MPKLPCCTDLKNRKLGDNINGESNGTEHENDLIR
jgi:hypothetical protein